MSRIEQAFTVVPATPQEKENILVFIEKLQNEENALHRSRRKGIDIREDYYNFLQKKSAHILLLKNKNETIGFVSGWIAEDDDFLQTPEWRQHGYISDIFVEEKYRGQGLGLILFDSMEDHLKFKGAKRFRICTLCVNKYAIALYRRAGYEPFEISYDKMP